MVGPHAQEHLGQMEPARERLKKLSQDYPLTYYGQLAEIRLGPTEFPTKQWAMLASTDMMNVETPAHLQQDIHYQKTQELRTLRLHKEAVQELEVVFARFGGDPKAFPQLVSLASEVGAYDVGIRLSIRHFGGTLRKGQLHSSSAAWLGAFPMGYQSVIQSFAPKHVDPFLVAGLIREESLYHARVVSPVGAIGLMQLMPETAKKVGRQLGLQDSDSDRKSLDEPNRNIQLGTHYLGQLLNEFQGNIIYAVAAYNAGPQAVKRWIGQNGHRDPDEFIELIGYRETRGYVKRVLILVPFLLGLVFNFKSADQSGSSALEKGNNERKQTRLSDYAFGLWQIKPADAVADFRCNHDCGCFISDR